MTVQVPCRSRKLGNLPGIYLFRITGTLCLTRLEMVTKPGE